MAYRKILLPGLLLGALLAGCNGDPEPEPDKDPDKVNGDNGKAPDTSKKTDWKKILHNFDEDQPVWTGPRLLAGYPGNAYHQTLMGSKKGFSGKKPVVLETNGSLETLYLLGWGYGEAGIVQADTLQDPRNRAMADNVQVVEPLFVEEVHILVHKDGPKKLKDLFGKQVAVTDYGTGSVQTAENLLEAAGAYDVSLVRTPSWDLPQIVTRGEVAAVILVGGAPLSNLLSEDKLDDVRFLDLKKSGELKSVLSKLKEKNENYVQAKVSYDKLGSATTVGILAVLVARKDAPAAVVSSLKKLDPKALASLHPKGAEIGKHELADRVGDDLSVVFRDPKLPIRIASGGTAGTYAAVADGLERAYEHSGGPMENLKTKGSFQNLMLLVSGQAELGIVQEDLISEALRNPATARLLARIRLLSPLYKEEVHFFRSHKDDVTGISSLKGKRVALGKLGSGSMITTLRLLRMHRLGLTDITPSVEGEHDALEGTKKGTVIGAFLVGGQQVATFLAYKPKFVALSDKPGYTNATLKAEGLYKDPVGMTDDIPTVATRALLVCRFDLEPDLATLLVETLYANRKNIAMRTHGHEKAAEIDKASLEEEFAGLKWHPGVEAAKDVEVDSADAWKEDE